MKRSVLATLAATMLLTGLGAPGGAYTRPGPTVRVSMSSTGQPANKGDAWYGPVVSADSRYVAFSSDADNLVPNDTNKAYDVFRRDLRTGKTTLVSVGINGTPSIGTCTDRPMSPSISATGRYIAFSSCASNLVVGDVYPGKDVFVRDMVTGTTTLATKSSNGVQSPVGGQSGFHALSGDGRYVAFLSFAPLTELTQPGSVDALLGATTAGGQIYVRDLVAGTTTLASASTNGDAGNASSGQCGYRFTASDAGISANGRYVVFDSTATNLTARAPEESLLGLLENRSGISHIYVRDLKTKRTEMVDVAADGTPATAPTPEALARCLPSQDATISGDGRYVAFTSSAQNLIPDAGHYERTIPVAQDVFLRDRQTGRTVRVDVTSAGENPRSPTDALIGAGSGNSGVVADSGRYVALGSLALGGLVRHDVLSGATQLVPSPLHTGTTAPAGFFADIVDGRFVAFSGTAPGETVEQAFLRDMGPTLGGGGLARSGALSVAGSTAFVASGLISATEWAPDLGIAAAERGADLVGASLVYRAEYEDVFVRELVHRMPSVGDPTSGAELLYGVNLTADGVRYQVRVQRVPGASFDAAGGASFGLFRLGDGAWSQVSTLRGGYGTTGEEVVVAIPLDKLGLARGGRIDSASTFTSVGAFATGATSVIDLVDLTARR